MVPLRFPDFAMACAGPDAARAESGRLMRTCAVQRNLNNAFAYDLVPSPSVITAALKAARRVNDYPTAVRIFEGTSCPTLLCLFRV